MPASYPPDQAPPPTHEATVPAEDWDVLFAAVLERLRDAVAPEYVDALLRARVLNCVEALQLLQHTAGGR